MVTDALPFLPGGLAALALGEGTLTLLAQPLELEPGHGEPRSGAGQLLGHLAHFVVERDRLALLDLLHAAQPLELLLEPRHVALERFDAPGRLVQHFLPRRHLH